MEIVRLVDRVGVNSIIEGQEFHDALIVGPAVIALLDRVTMINCGFDGDEDSLFIEVAPDRGVLGVVGIVNTRFERCRFQNIGIVGPPEAVALMKEELFKGTEAHKAQLHSVSQVQPLRGSPAPDSPVAQPAE